MTFEEKCNVLRPLCDELVTLMGDYNDPTKKEYKDEIDKKAEPIWEKINPIVESMTEEEVKEFTEKFS
jgi:hypothetical protein